MKKLLRVLVLVLTTLLTLPWLIALAAMLLASEWSNAEKEGLNEYGNALITNIGRWIQTGKLIQTEEESE